MVPLDTGPPDWMSKVPGSLPLSALSLPGTHDSACRRGAVKLGLASLGGDFVFTQYAENNLAAQLDMGVRFFDYRVEHEGNLRHGSAELQGNLSEELRSMVYFLNQHRGECVCVSVKWEKEEIDLFRMSADSIPEPDGMAAWVVSTMINVCGREQLWLEPRTPTLDEARGKVVFLTRFNAATPEGIRYNPGGEDVGSRNNPPFRSQDHYDLTEVMDNAPAEKFGRVLDFMYSALRNDDEMHVWYFNFTSGYAGKPPGFDHLNPVEIAWDCEFQGRQLRGVNTLLLEFLKDRSPGRIGTLLMDFVNPELVKAIYDMNQFI